MNDLDLKLTKIEENDLKTRIENLYDFTQSDKFEEVDNFQRHLLFVQLEAMRTYWRCLIARLNDFENSLNKN